MIMDFKKYSFLGFLIGFSVFSFSQEQTILLLFPKQTQGINPALISIKKETNLGLVIDSQWLGIKDAPKQQTLFFESFSKTKKINFGGLIRNRNRFVENSTQFLGQFSYPIQLNSLLILHLGIQGGGDFYELNFDYLRLVDGVAVDPLIQKKTHLIPNLGIGFHLNAANFSFQGSFPRLLGRRPIQLFLPNRLYYFSEIGWTSQRIGSSNLLQVSLQFHNLGINEIIAQAKGSFSLRFGEIYLGMNSEKSMGIGFLFHSKRVLSLGYAFQFPFALNSELKLNNHSIYLQFKLKKQNATNEVL